MPTLLTRDKITSSPHATDIKEESEIWGHSHGFKLLNHTMIGGSQIVGRHIHQIKRFTRALDQGLVMSWEDYDE